MQSECRHHGLTDHFLAKGEMKFRCRKCRSEAVARRRKAVKAKLVEEAGGACVRCGYDKCLRALNFHHRDPSQKSFGLARKGETKALGIMREEAKKCDLLCANCHMEVEDLLVGGRLARQHPVKV